MGSLYITSGFVKQSIYIGGMRRNFCYNLFQIFGRRGRSVSALLMLVNVLMTSAKSIFLGKKAKIFLLLE